MKYLKETLALLSMTFGSVASASIEVGNVSFADTDIQYPNESSFVLNYQMFGSQIFNPSDSFVDFYLTLDGGQTGYALGRGSAGVRCSQSNLSTICTGASGQQRLTVPSNINYDTQQMLSNLCEPLTFQAVAKYNLSTALSLNTANIGTIKPADWLIESGKVTPNVVPSGGTVTINASSITNCQARQSVPSTLGVYLTDLDNNALIYFGEGALPMPYGGSMNITVQIPSFIAPGQYRLFLIADHNQASSESNEANNQAYAGLTITAAGAVSSASVNEPSVNSSGYTSYLDRIAVDQSLYINSGMYEEKGIQFKQGKAQAAQTPQEILGRPQAISEPATK